MLYASFANLTGPQSSHSVFWYFIFNIWLIIPSNNSLVRWCILAMLQECMDASVVCSLNLTPQLVPLYFHTEECNLTFLYLSHKYQDFFSNLIEWGNTNAHPTTFLDTPTYLIVPTCIFSWVTRSVQDISMDTPYTFHRLSINSISVFNSPVGKFCSTN